MSALASISRRRLGLVLVGGMAVAVAGTGCGSQDGDGSVRTIKIATAAESKPLSWGAIGHTPQGYEPDVLKAINAKLPQYKFEMEGAADIAQETGLATGKYDMIAGGYFKTPERDKQFLIPDNAAGASLMKIYVRGDDTSIAGMPDLVGKRVVPVSAGGGVYKFVTQWQKGNPGKKVNISTSNAGVPYPDRLKEVQNGKYDALILPSNLGEQTVIKEQQLNIKVSEPVSTDNTYFLIHKSGENKKLVDGVNKVLKELREDGTLGKLSTKWFGEDETKYMK